MVNIGVLGDFDTGQEDVLRRFVKVIEDVSLIKGFHPNSSGLPSVVKADFSREATLPSMDDGKEVKTKHSIRVVFRIGKYMHTIFAPVGDNRPLVRMGINTISRIARIVCAVIDLSKDIDSQFEYYSAVRFIPKSIFIVWTRENLLQPQQRDEKIGRAHV